MTHKEIRHKFPHANWVRSAPALLRVAGELARRVPRPNGEQARRLHEDAPANPFRISNKLSDQNRPRVTSTISHRGILSLQKAVTARQAHCTPVRGQSGSL